METKTSINDVSAPGNSILETGTENSRLEGQLPSGENIVTSNEEPFECDLRRLAKPQSDEISLYVSIGLIIEDNEALADFVG